jgi:hypothetical protein
MNEPFFEWDKAFNECIQNIQKKCISLDVCDIHEDIEKLYTHVESLKNITKEKEILIRVKRKIQTLMFVINDILSIQKNIMYEHVCDDKNVYGQDGVLGVEQNIFVLKKYG